MRTDFFLMDNRGGVHTTLWRRKVGHVWLWVDAPPGEAWELDFEDDDGHPCDIFGLPLRGEFVEAFVKKDRGVDK